MYQPSPNDVSGRDFQEEMRAMLVTLIPVYEASAENDTPIGAALIQEFDDMLEFAGATVTGVDNRARAVTDYLEYHYRGGSKPKWYANLCGG